MFKIIPTCLISAALLVPTSANALDMGKARDLYDNKLKTWLEASDVISAIEKQNVEHESLSEEDIIALDTKWRGGDAGLIDPVLSNDLSTYLRGVVEGGEGLYTEIFVMDNKGLNVGQSDKTSDYWQGDEAKFQETFSIGEGTIHLSEVEFDESTQTYQVQLSVTISKDGVPIGAATVGLDAEAIE